MNALIVFFKTLTPKTASLLLIGLFTLWHLFLAGRLNLSVDEAHYALYGAKLALSYYDHPPLVGWLNALPVWLVPSDFGLRILPATFFAISMALVYQIACRLFPTIPWIGFWSIVLIIGSLMFQLLSISMLPDTPLMIASLMVFLTLLNLRDAPTLKHWLWLGFWLGIAGLSKYTAITLVFSLLLVMILEKRFEWLKNRGLWLAILLATVMISPVIVWNAQHDWISFLYQLNHGTHHDNWDWLRVMQTQLAQLAVYSPVLYLLGLYLAIKGLFQSEATRLLALFALPILILFALGSGYEMSLPHWTQQAWLFLAPAVTAWGMTLWQHKWLRIFVYFGGGFILITSLILNVLLATSWLPGQIKPHPLQELVGWPEAIAIAEKHQQQYDVPLVAANWTQASRIGWYAYPQPVYVTDNRFDQFDLWYGNPPDNSNGIVITPNYEGSPKTGKPGHFRECLPIDQLEIIRHQQTIVRYDFFYCQHFIPVHYQGWVTQLPLVNGTDSQN